MRPTFKSCGWASLFASSASHMLAVVSLNNKFIYSRNSNFYSVELWMFGLTASRRSWHIVSVVDAKALPPCSGIPLKLFSTWFLWSACKCFNLEKVIESPLDSWFIQKKENSVYICHSMKGFRIIDISSIVTVLMENIFKTKLIIT